MSATLWARTMSTTSCSQVSFSHQHVRNNRLLNWLHDRFDPETNLLYPSIASFTEKPPSKLAVIVLKIFSKLGLVQLTKTGDGKVVSTTNLTILNVFLVRLGSMSEKRLVQTLIATQVCLPNKVIY